MNAKRLRGLALGAMALSSIGLGLLACEEDVLRSDQGPLDGGYDGASQLDAGDASSAMTDASDASDGGALSCPERAWPAMLAAPIVPLQSAANLDWNHGGAATITLAYAESVNCPSTPLGDPGYDGGLQAAWGPSQDVAFIYGKDAPNLFSVLYLRGAYSGTVTFHSRAGSAFGNHDYVLGIGKLLRDGSPFTIDWTGSSATTLTPAAIQSVTELYDAIMATFAPSYPASSDCHATIDCLIVPDDLASEANDGGVPSRAVVGFRPLKLYVEMPVGTSTPSDFYAFVTGGPELENPPPVDAGNVPGTDAGGGVALPAGCRYGSGDAWGSCEHPVKPLCGTQPGWSVLSCRDYPQSGYVVSCCPSDGG